MIKLTREQLLRSEDGLKILSEQKLPIGVAFRINKIIKKVADVFQETHSIRNEIIERYATKNEQGEIDIDKETSAFTVSEENRSGFVEEMAIMLAEQCEIMGEPIEIDLLKDVNLSSQDLTKLEPFLLLE